MMGELGNTGESVIWDGERQSDLDKSKPLLILTGPTAVGKTALSLALAKRLSGEIVSADSMQVYRGMDIGSAKIRPSEMAGIPHHLIDIIEPTENFDVHRFAALAKAAVKEIHDRGHLPIVVGGTGFYIQALLYDIAFTKEDDDGVFRRELEKEAELVGSEALHHRLAEVDPVAAEEIHPNNRKRVIRALEYYHLTGERISEHNHEQRRRPSPYTFWYFVLNDKRSRIYQAIDERVDEMLRQGLVDEVKRLRFSGVKRDMTSMQGIGYREVYDYLDGVYDYDEMVRLIKRNTRHFAKRQLTWFRRERDVIWLNRGEFDGVEGMVSFVVGRVRGD